MVDTPGIPGLTSAPDTVTTAVAYLLASLGLSSSAGLRAYLALLAVGIASHVTGPNGQPYLQLQPDLTAFGSPPVLALLAILAVLEFIVDKVPGIDHVSDAIHTVVRPIAGALILAAVQNPISDHSQVAAAVIGGALALGVHGMKAGTRATSTATTAGAANPGVSLVEDVLSILVMALLVVAPVIGFILLVIVLYIVWRMLRGVFRAFFGGPRRGNVGAGNTPGVPPAGGAPGVSRPVLRSAPPARPRVGGIIGAMQAAHAARAAQLPSAAPSPEALAPAIPATPAPPLHIPTPRQSAPWIAPHAAESAPPPVAQPFTAPQPRPAPPIPYVEPPNTTQTLPMPWEQTWPDGPDAQTIPSAPSSSAPTWPYDPYASYPSDDDDTDDDTDDSTYP